MTETGRAIHATFGLYRIETMRLRATRGERPGAGLRVRKAFGVGRAVIRASLAIAIASLLLTSLFAFLGSAFPAAAKAENMGSSHAAGSPASPAEAPLRLISLNPSLTAILVRLGATEMLVGVDDYSARVLPEVSNLPRVGGLFDPSLEAVVALRPDRVLIVAGVEQVTHAERLERLGLRVEIYPNERMDEILENIERLGRLVGRESLASTRVSVIRETRRAVFVATRGLEAPGTVAIVDRSPLFLVGGETFLDEMLDVVGARNLVRELGAGYPRGSIEWLIATGPSLLLDMTPGAEAAKEFWSRWPSLPAVAADRVVGVDAARITMPGPNLDRALRELALLVHGASIEDAIDEALKRGRAESVLTDRDHERPGPGGAQ